MKKLVGNIRNVSPQNIFLVSSLIWGVIMIFIVPPFQVPDEPAHFYRAYQVSELEFVSKVRNNKLGGELPSSLRHFHVLMRTNQNDKLNDQINKLKSALKIELNHNKQSFLFFPNTSLYSPIPYFPQAIGISAGKIFKLSPLILLYLARLSNLIVWILIIFYTIKIIPIKKMLFAALALTPMSLYIAASSSADALLNATTFLFIALVLRHAFVENNYLNKKNIIVLTIIALIITLSKNIYIIVTLLFLIIPYEKSGTKKKHIKNAILIFSLTFIAFLVSSLYVKTLLDKIQVIEEIYGKTGIPEINPKEQVQFILSDIPGFLEIVFKSFLMNWRMIGGSFIGYLGYMEIIFPIYYYVLIYLILIFLAIFEKGNVVTIRLRNKFIIVFIIIAIILAFSFTMYCSWCEPGSSIISNLQGRYFIPIAPLALLTLFNKKFTINDQLPFKIIIIFSVMLSFGITINALMQHYYL